MLLIGYLVKRRRRLKEEKEKLLKFKVTCEMISNILSSFIEINLQGNENENKEKECPICLEEFNNQKTIVNSPCNHYFHFDCIHAWVSLNLLDSKCPMCNYLFKCGKQEQIVKVDKENIFSQNYEREFMEPTADRKSVV